MYKVIAAGIVGLADTQEAVEAKLQATLNLEAQNGFKVVAATAELIILEKAGRKPGRPKKEVAEPRRSKAESSESESEG